MQLRLVLIVDNTRGQSILVTGSPWSIGRNDDCNLRLKNQSVSRKHCELKLKEAGWTVRDLGSTYGTTINNFPVPQDKRALLKSGDRLKIGQYIFEVEIQTEKPVDGPADEQIASLDDSLPDLDSLLDRALDAPLPTQTWNP